MFACLNRIASIAMVSALLTSVPSAHAANAASEKASEKAAISVSGGSCTGFVPTEQGELDRNALIQNSAHKVHRIHSSGGGFFAMCQFDVPEDLVPASVRTAEGFGCVVNAAGDRTTESKMQVTPGGRAMLLCRLR